MTKTSKTAAKTSYELAWEKARKPANDARKQNAQYQAAMRASYEPDGDDSWLDDSAALPPSQAAAQWDQETHMLPLTQYTRKIITTLYIVRHSDGELEAEVSYGDLSTYLAGDNAAATVFEVQYDPATKTLVSEDVTDIVVRELAKDGDLGPDDDITRRFGDWSHEVYSPDGDPRWTDDPVYLCAPVNVRVAGRAA